MYGLDGAWAISREKLEAMVLFAKHLPPSTDAQFEAFLRQTSQLDAGEDRFIRDGTTARIPVVGTLTRSPSFFFSLFEGRSSTYGDIVAALEEATSDSKIKRIVLEISSPGGEVLGMFDAMMAVRLAVAKMEVVAEVTDIAASAAFGIMSQATRAVANNSAAMLGSIGIVTNRFVSDFQVTISSTEAPNKAPDPTTEAGVKAIRSQLDDLHKQFATAIAEGRGTDLETVNKNFGRGAIVLADAAVSAGMIDSISDQPAVSNSSGEVNMDLAQFKVEHPGLYTQLFELGTAEGVKQERDRCVGHAKMGESFGAATEALKFIREGTPVGSGEATATYLAAGIAAKTGSDRVADDAAVPEVPAGEDKTPAAASPDAPKAIWTDDGELTDEAATKLFDEIDTEDGPYRVNHA